MVNLLKCDCGCKSFIYDDNYTNIVLLVNIDTNQSSTDNKDIYCYDCNKHYKSSNNQFLNLRYFMKDR